MAYKFPFTQLTGFVFGFSRLKVVTYLCDDLGLLVIFILCFLHRCHGDRFGRCSLRCFLGLSCVRVCGVAKTVWCCLLCFRFSVFFHCGLSERNSSVWFAFHSICLYLCSCCVGVHYVRVVSVCNGND